jgi:hypothetical protein
VPQTPGVFQKRNSYKSLTRQNTFLRTAARLADVALVTGGALALSLFVYFFYYYSLTGQRHFSSPVYYVLYYVCPFALAVCLFASLTFKPAHRVNLSIAVGTSVALMYGLEAFFESGYSIYASTTPVMLLLQRSTDKGKDAAALEKAWGITIDTRSADEVIAALRNKGVDAVPFVSPSLSLFVTQSDGSIRSALNIGGVEVMPLGAMSNKLTVLCNENGYWVQYNSDQHGFNNPTEAWQVERLEIAAVGDSFTQGYCVPAEKSFVGLIRQRYPATLNLGIAGNGPLLTLATLREHLPRFRPKIVLWFYCEANDLVDLQNERRSAVLRNYLKEGFTQSALARQTDIDRAISDEIPGMRALEQARRKRSKDSAVVNRLMTFARLSSLREATALVGGMDANESRMAADAERLNMDAFRDVLLQATAAVDAWGGQFEFVYLPDWTDFTNYKTRGKEKRGEVLAVVRGLGIPIIDLVPAFEAHGAPLTLFPFQRGGHYNEMGHRVVAEQVLKALTVLPPNRD